MPSKNQPKILDSIFLRLTKIVQKLPNNPPNYYNVTITLRQVQMMQQQLCRIYYTNGHKESLDLLLRGMNSVTWWTGLTNEIGCIAQGIKIITGSDVVDFIFKTDIPKHNVVTYANIVSAFCFLIKENYKVQLTVDRNKLPYAFDVASPAAPVIKTKLLLNRTISQSVQGVRIMTLDIEVFLHSLIKEPEYMKMLSKYFTTNIWDTYKLHKKVSSDDYIHCRIKMGMHGLKEAACLAYDRLKEYLQGYGYISDTLSPNIWSHISRLIKFCMCIDDSSAKYFSIEDKYHLITSFQKI